MIRSLLQEEIKLRRRGFKKIAGLDEVGCGPLAGPVVAAAAMIGPDFRWSKSHFGQMKDSKKLSPEKREVFYNILTTHPDVWWGIGRVSEKAIDRINIRKAVKLAMLKAVKDLSQKLSPFDCYRHKKEMVDFLILDGNFRINSDTPQKSIVKADENVFSCIAASIIAKVTRDKIMERLHKKYPEYGFDRHKGYGTKAHMAMLKKYGPCRIHRKTFIAP